MTYADLERYRTLKKEAVRGYDYAMQEPYPGWSPNLELIEALIWRFEVEHRDIRPLSVQR